MVASWWDEIHEALWQVSTDAVAVKRSARSVARDVAAPLIAGGVRSVCEWTVEKQRVLKSLDEAGLTSFVSRACCPVTMQIAIAASELAYVDGGAAACLFSGFLPQMIIRDFGTLDQQERYLDCPERRHGALCLTEALPGAGTEALRLECTIRVAELGPGPAITLQVEKRGRFTSHMEFADFVVAAVAPVDSTVRSSCLVILEPSDAGVFDRGVPQRKLGHQLSSTTSPVFSLRVAPERIVGGFAVRDNVLTPTYSHGEALGPALRRARAIAAAMTAAKVLSAVRTVMIHRRNGGALAEDWPNRLADIWAAGEAAAALAFASARLCDILDVGGNSAESRKGVELVVPCAKLFATAHASRFLLDAISLIGPSALVEDAPYFLGGLASDAVVEAMYLGPESVQRRQIVAALNADAFDSSLDDWLSESHQEARQPETGARSLAAGMELWRFVLGHLKGRRDDRGVALCSDANQGTAFLLADALCLLLAAQSLVRGVGGLRDSDARQHLEAPIHFFTDLGAAHAARVAGMVGQSCTELFFGCAHRFRFSEQELREFGALRARLDISLSGSADARNRAAQFVRAVASA